MISASFCCFVRDLARIIFGEDTLLNGCLQEEKVMIQLEGMPKRTKLEDKKMNKLISIFYHLYLNLGFN